MQEILNTVTCISNESTHYQKAEVKISINERGRANYNVVFEFRNDSEVLFIIIILFSRQLLR